MRIDRPNYLFLVSQDGGSGAKRLSDVFVLHPFRPFLNPNRFSYLNDGLGDLLGASHSSRSPRPERIRQLRAKGFLEYLRHMDCSAFGAPRVVSSLLRLGTNGPVDGAIKRDQYAPPLRGNRKVVIGIDHLSPS